ncbi:MAG: hypothetical protein V3V81_08015 [Candidatus Bathyarchaeia archaeon]
MERLDDKPCKGCKIIFTPKVEWQKFHDKACHDTYWKGVYRDRAAMNKRMEAVEKELGIK